MVFVVARQESSFNPVEKSSAGALGLIQLLPSTARETARKNKISYSKSRLTSKPAYKALLDSAFIAELVRGFDGSYLLAFAVYNGSRNMGILEIPMWTQ